MKSSSPRRILLVRFYFIGDVLLVTPLFCAIKQRFPECHVTLLTDEPADGVVLGHPAVDEILVCRLSNWKNRLAREKTRHFWRLWRALQRQRFDFALNLQPGDRGGIWTWLSGARCRAAYDVPDERMIYYNHRLPFFPKGRPRIEHMMDALRGIGWDVPEDTPERLLRLPSMGFSDAERQTANRVLDAANWNIASASAPLIAIHPGRIKSRKTWFNDRFARVADELIRRWNARVVWLGAPDEAERIGEIQGLMEEKSTTLSVAGRLSLKEVGALLEKCDLFIGIDSSPMHIASAVDTPTVSLFSFSELAVWKPRDMPDGAVKGTRHIALQKQQPENPCAAPRCCEIGNSPCMLAISVDDVLNAAAAFLDNTER